jgi:urea transport system substrate-binding protein
MLAGVGALAVGAALFAWLAVPLLARTKSPIRVGLLHSLTGPLAISEKSMVDAERLAIEELNARGGLLGRRVEGVIADGGSDWRTFAREAERLIEQEKVCVIVGCWSSADRKSVKPVVERTNHLLIYPVAYEGLEQSPNIVYTAAAPNQIIIPTIKWSRDFLKAKSYYLIGTDTIWPRSVNEIIKDQLKALGASLVGEEYLEFGTTAVEKAVETAVKAKPDVIISAIEGETNLPLYRKIRASGSEGRKIPVISFPVAEDELRHLPVKDMVNDYLVCNYFQAVDRPENRAFVKAFKARYGQDRVTSDSIESAYNSVHFWAQAVREAETDEVGEVRATLLRQSLDAPEGIISIDRETQHTWRPFFIGRVRGDGQVEIVESSTKPIRPAPFPFSRTREQWEAFLESLRAEWDGSWAPPAGRRPVRPS